MADGRFLQPGVRLQNLLPSFDGSASAGVPGQQRGPQHVPQQSSPWTNPARAPLQPRARAADAEFTVRLGMPLNAGGRASRNTDEYIPAFERPGRTRRPGAGAAFEPSKSEVFSPHAGEPPGGFPTRSTRGIGGEEDGGEEGATRSGGSSSGGGGAADAAAGGEVVLSLLDETPVRMHPFFSGDYDPLVDYSLKVDVPVRGEFRCLAAGVSFDLFELDRTNNTSASGCCDAAGLLIGRLLM
jgi:hypothetical protein